MSSLLYTKRVKHILKKTKIRVMWIDMPLRHMTTTIWSLLLLSLANNGRPLYYHYDHQTAAIACTFRIMPNDSWWAQNACPEFLYDVWNTRDEVACNTSLLIHGEKDDERWDYQHLKCRMLKRDGNGDGKSWPCIVRDHPPRISVDHTDWMQCVPTNVLIPVLLGTEEEDDYF